jgi:hypothetical protein
MSEKKHKKNILSQRERIAQMQQNRDRERLEKFRYFGSQLELENSMIKSQIVDLRRPAKVERSLPAMAQSQSATHLPIIKKYSERAESEFLKEVRERNWKMYMNTREVIEGNKTQETQNQVLKRKLFNYKYKDYLKHAKSNCKMAWERLEELRAAQGESIVDPHAVEKGFGGKQESKPIQKESQPSHSTEAKPVPKPTVAPEAPKPHAQPQKPANTTTSKPKAQADGEF